MSHRLALFVLRRDQGRLAEIEELMRRSVHEYPALPRFTTALAHLYAELGREREARTLLDELLSRDLAREHLDAEWLFTINVLADVAAFLGDEEKAARVYELLAPFSGLYAEAPMEACFGSVARGLGVAATVLGRWDDAEAHFTRAVEIELSMRARPWTAHARHGHATMLFRKGDPRARRRAARRGRRRLPRAGNGLVGAARRRARLTQSSQATFT